MKKLTTRWYYSLKEIIEKYNEEKELGLDVNYLDVLESEGTSIGLSSISQRMLEILDEQHIWAADSNKAVKMFTQYLWPEYQDASVVYADTLVNPWELGPEQEEPEFEDIEEEMNPILLRFIRWIVESQERYEVLINSYESIEDKLLAQVRTISEAQASSTSSNEVESASTGSSTGAVESSNRESSSSLSSGSESGSTSASGSEETIRNENSTKVHLHNDTPQSSWSNGFETDPYVSNMDKDTNSNRIVNGVENASTTSSSATSNTSTENLNNGSSSTSNESATTNTSSTSASARGSNLQSSIVGTDVTTPIERLNEIRQKLHNLYVDWADEFAQFVIYAD